MYIQQISIFVENKPGKVTELTDFLASNNINLRALEVAEASDYGIIRIIVDDPFATMTALKDNDWVCKITDVVGVEFPDEPGSMAKVAKVISDAGINVDYCYAFLTKSDNNAMMIFKVQDNKNVVHVLQDSGINIVSQSEVANK